MGCFACITVPRRASDLKRLYPAARCLPAGLVEAMAPRLFPGRASPITGIRSSHASADGWLVTCPVTGGQLTGLPLPLITGRIATAAKMAAGLGAKVIGIGPLAALGDVGIRISEGLGLEVTSGGNMALSAALDAARMASGLLERSVSSSEVALFGAETQKGSAAARILAREVGSLTLVAEGGANLSGLADTIKGETGLVPRIVREAESALGRCHIAVFAGRGAGDSGRLRVRRGAVVCRLGPGPWDLPGDLRPDVLLVDGGLVGLPGEVQIGGGQGFLPRECDPGIAEAAVLAMEEGSRRPSLAVAVTAEGVDEIGALARKHGFLTTGILACGRPLRREEIDRAREAAGVS